MSIYLAGLVDHIHPSEKEFLKSSLNESKGINFSRVISNMLNKDLLHSFKYVYLNDLFVCLFVCLFVGLFVCVCVASVCYTREG